MKRVRMSSKVLIKYFVSYLFVFFIPFSVLGILVYNNAVVTLKNEIEKSNLNKLSQVSEVLNLQMRVLEHTASKISVDHRLTRFVLKNDSYNEMEAIEELNRYRDNSTIADEVMLYFRGDNMIYSSTGTNSLSTLTRDIYKFANWEEKNFVNDINNINQFVIRPAETININNNETSRMLTFLFPIPNNSLYAYGTVIFFVRETMLTKRIENILGDFSGSVYILDNSNSVLASKKNDNDISAAEVLDIMKHEKEKDIFDVKKEGESFSISSIKSENTGWTFMTIMPTNQFMSHVFELRKFILTILLFLVIIGLSMIIMLSRKLYMPIKTLEEHVRSIWNINSSNTSGKPISNEFDIIRNTVDAVYIYNKALITQIDTQMPLAREQFIIRLLKGDFNSREEIFEMSGFLKLPLSGPYYYVTLISLDDKFFQNCGIKNRDQILKALASLNIDDMCIYSVELIKDNVIALINCISSIQKIEQKNQEEFGFTILNILMETCGISPAIGVGKVYEDVLKIQRSFLEASTALDYKLKAGKGSIILFEKIQINQNKEILWYPIEELLTLVQGMKQGDRNLAIEALRFIINSIGKKEQSIIFIRYRCIDIINTILKTIDEMKATNIECKVEDILNFNTLDELQVSLEHLVALICDYVNKSKESKNMVLRDEVLCYIRKNFKSMDVSLENAALQFGISPSYLSRFIKEQTGSTFTEYLLKLRMDEVKYQLKHTVKPVKSIISEIGYMDVSNFIRSFKKFEGITPGQFRSLYAQEDNKKQI